jgi:hypothetical protein
MQYGLQFILVLAPFVALAQAPSNFRELVGVLLGIVNVLVPVVFALTFVVLAWGIIRAWILNAGDEHEIERGKHLVIVGVIALVIMSGIWGILELLRRGLFGV